MPSAGIALRLFLVATVQGTQGLRPTGFALLWFAAIDRFFRKPHLRQPNNNEFPPAH
ncbi:hypothetical protein D3C80_2186330 [compost metagenome]